MSSSFFKKIGLLFILFFTVTCAPTTAPPDTVNSPPLKPVILLSITDPESGLKGALDAYKAGNNEKALLASYKLAEEFPESAWYKRSLFLTELVFIQMDRPSEADAAMLQVQDDFPVMGDYAVFMLAEYHFSKARYTQAAALYQHLLDRYPKSFLTERAAYRGAEALVNAFQFAPAAEAFEKFLHGYPRSELCPDAHLGLARALTAEGDLSKAVEAYRDAWIKYPGITDAEVKSGLDLLRGGGADVPEPGPAELCERGKNLFRTSQYDRAVETFTKVLTIDPRNPNKAEIMLRTGIALFNLGNRTEALSTFQKMVKEHPGDERIPEALYWVGKTYFKIGENDKGIKAFQKIIDSHFKSEWADDALYRIGNIYRDAQDMKKALTFYKRLAKEYPKSRFADSAIWWCAWSYYNAGEYGKSEQTLEGLVNAHPRSLLVSQARYWQGRAAEKMGDGTKAAGYYAMVVKRWPYSYYGYRAGERLKKTELPEAPLTDISLDVDSSCEEEACPGDHQNSYDNEDGPPVWTAEALTTLSADAAFMKSLELLHMNMKKEAATELWSLQERLPRRRGALLGLSKTFFELGDYYRSLVLVLRNYERYLDGVTAKTPEDFWLLAYPQGYWNSILAYSNKYGQDPYFVAAVIRQESQFYPEALSPAGARGLMQVMPSTGAWAARTIGIPDFDQGKLFDSDMAINIGTWYISHLMKRFKGDPLLVAAAYNAGPDAVSAWLSRNGPGRERDEFVEAIPFFETRGYVKKVLRNYAEYRRIYSKTVQALPAVMTGEEAKAASLLTSRETNTQ